MKQAAGQTVYTEDEAIQAANHLGYPVLMRPSYVLGGQNMIIAYNDADIHEYMKIILSHKIENAILIDKYLMGTELEVDAICDGETVLIPGIMEHIERAGVHSGDSIAVYPAFMLTESQKDRLVDYSIRLALSMNTKGLINIQYVLHEDTIYIIEVNPRSSRTVPYISKVTGVPMVDLATRIMMGEKLADMGYETGLYPCSPYYAVKVPVFSFEKLSNVDTQLGPEMKSTGEVLGIARTMEEALFKGLVAAGYTMKREGGVLISVRDTDKSDLRELVKEYVAMGFHIYATSGTASRLNSVGISSTLVKKPKEAKEGEKTTISLLEEGKISTVKGVIYGRVQVGGGKRMQITTAYVKDLTGTLKVIWFRMPFLRNTLKQGMPVIIRGRVVSKKDQLIMEHPELFSPPDSYDKKCGTLQPIYPLTAGMTNNAVAKAVKGAMEYLDLVSDDLPKDLRLRYHLAEYNYAIRGIHFPLDKAEFYHARERLVFEEFLVFVLALRRTRERNERAENGFMIKRRSEIDRFLANLPYELTGAQKRVWEQIQEEMCGKLVMSRLIQGDVGSGKTIVALLALLLAALNGYQGAMMAPTEVLAKQHYESIIEMLEKYQIPVKTELLTGSMTAKEKREAYQRIAAGEVQIVLGTHALIQEKVEYQNLALVVTDEQHRFGVRQREALAGKGQIPHILVMSATPIPRTLAIILYGDLDISVIDELPANRLPIKNCVVDTSYRPTAYRFMQKQVAEGRQCYVICPMVEESEAMDAENVLDYAQLLQSEMGDKIRIAALHGRMKQAEKDEIMGAFAKNEIQVLVSTTVIEVGINVPNATVIMVENAERFGLAQLHQLRGRVGRGRHQSYCIFMSGSKTKETKKRLEILNKSNDGFFIANEDLKLRGPGDLFGIRQSGLMDFRIGDVFQDSELLKKAGEASGEILREDPLLEGKKYKLLGEKLAAYISGNNLETTL